MHLFARWWHFPKWKGQEWSPLWPLKEPSSLNLQLFLAWALCSSVSQGMYVVDKNPGKQEFLYWWQAEWVGNGETRLFLLFLSETVLRWP